MRAMPIGQRVRTGLAAGAAAVLIAAAACTTATAGSGQSSGQTTGHSTGQTPSRAQNASQGPGTGLVVATAGGAVLTQSIKTALASGQFNRVPVIIGTNHDEYRPFVAAIQFLGERVTAANYQSMIASTLDVDPAVASTIATHYPLSRYPSPSVALGAVGTDAIFACHAHRREVTIAVRPPPFTGTSQQVLSLVPPRPQPETDFPAEHHCAFWAPEP